MTDISRAGVAIVDISPPKGIELGGYPHYRRYNAGINDPLYASCIYMEDTDQSVAIVGLDQLFLSRRYILDIRRAASEKTGIPAANIMVCCSHSHSSPSCAHMPDNETPSPHSSPSCAHMPDNETPSPRAAYLRELLDKLVGVIVSAQRTAFDCVVGFGRAACGPELGIGGNRRDPVNGPSDPFAYVVGIKDKNDITRCVLVNYALHPTVMHEDNLLCSADYPGFIRERLRELYPRAVTVFTLGTAGDQSTRYFRRGQDFNEAERIGRTIGGAASLAVESALYTHIGALSAQSAAFNPKLRQMPTYNEALASLDEKRATYERLKNEGVPYAQVQSANVERLGAESIVRRVEAYVKRNATVSAPAEADILTVKSEELPSEISLLSINDINILFLPGEIFVGVAQNIRRRCPGVNLIIATVANGCLPGYLYTADEAAYGGYEIETSMLDASAAALLEDAAVSLIKQN